jgi:hypothetical protein
MLANWIKQTTATTGASDLTVAAVSAYPTLAQQYAIGERFPYCIVDSSGQPIEAGIGYLSTSTNMVREKVLETYSGGAPDDTAPSAVSLTGTNTIIVPALAQMVQGASKGVNRNASLAVQKFVFSQHMTIHNSSSAGYTCVANRLVYVPYWLTASIECDAMGVRCGTGVAGTNVRLGIWDVKADGHPGKLLAETGALSTATSGTDVIGTLGATLRLNPDWYYVSLVSDGAPAVGRATLGGELFNYLGVSGGNLMQFNAAFYGTHTFGPLPDPALSTSLSIINAGAAYPAIGLRCA